MASNLEECSIHSIEGSLVVSVAPDLDKDINIYVQAFFIDVG